MTVRTRRLTDRADVLAGIDLWNECHPEFAVDDRLVEQNVFAPFDGVDVAAWGSVAGDDLIGFALTKRLTAPIPDYAGTERGWISLLAVDPGRDDFETVAGDLLSTAEDALADGGATRIDVGTDVQNFLAGLPAPLVDRYDSVLADAGYEAGGSVYDLARDVTDFRRPDRVVETLAVESLRARPVEPDETDELLSFLADQFPGRWRYEAENVVRIPGGVSDYWTLRRDGEIVAFVRTNRCDSPYLGPNLTWGRRLADRYCGLGPVGVHENERGNGYGLALIAEATAALREAGYTHAVVDWTGLLDYYAKLGFEPFVEYVSYATRRR